MISFFIYRNEQISYFHHKISFEMMILIEKYIHVL